MLRKDNTENIDEVLAKIKELCLKYNLRVGQLINNVEAVELAEDEDIFHFSNYHLLETLKRFDER